MPSRELVPGDLIELKLGDIVPADAILLEGQPVQVDQAALTGESLPVTIHPDGKVKQGSALKRGEIKAVVVATGTSWASLPSCTHHLVVLPSSSVADCSRVRCACGTSPLSPLAVDCSCVTSAWVGFSVGFVWCACQASTRSSGRPLP